MTAEAVSLFGALVDIAKFRKYFGIEAAEGIDDPHQESIEEAQTTFKLAKKAMSIIATATALYSMTGPSRTKECDNLTKKPSDLPKSMKKEIERALAGTGADSATPAEVAAAPAPLAVKT